MEFDEALENKVRDLVTTYVGVGTDPSKYVKAIDDHLRDFDIKTENPFVVVTCRQVEPAAQEIGARADETTWIVQIYILAVDKSWATGKSTRSFVANRLRRALGANPLLDSFSFTSPDGYTDAVWSSQVESATFDGSGEDGYYTFVTEMHLRVDVSTT